MRRPGRPALGVLAAGVLLVAACSGGDDGGDDDGRAATVPTTTETTVAEHRATTTTTPPPEGNLDEISLAVEEVAVLESPTAMAPRPSTSDLYVTEQSGRVRVIDVTEATSSRPARYQLLDTPALDLTEEVLAGGERGLLGIAFSSDGRFMYVNFTARPDGTTTVLEYEMTSGRRVDEDSRRELLQVGQPYANHNGGNLVVGPDGYLYIGLGDGGSAGDPQGNGQDPSTLLGSILRIDPLGVPADGGSARAYGIPAGNPFVDAERGRPETWLVGVRNPWRFSFDADTGDLWVADVGQDRWEEIDLLPATGGFDAGRGANLGWNEMEGSHSFAGSNPEGAVLPIYEYGRDEGCSITGGYIYRGSAIEALQGTYLFGDYCAPGIRGIQVADGAVIDERTWDLPLEGVQSFGQDAQGELFVLLASGPVLQLVAPG